jgi:hypothetical protein
VGPQPLSRGEGWSIYELRAQILLAIIGTGWVARPYLKALPFLLKAEVPPVPAGFGVRISDLNAFWHR